MKEKYPDNFLKIHTQLESIVNPSYLRDLKVLLDNNIPYLRNIKDRQESAIISACARGIAAKYNLYSIIP